LCAWKELIETEYKYSARTDETITSANSAHEIQAVKESNNRNDFHSRFGLGSAATEALGARPQAEALGLVAAASNYAVAFPRSKAQFQRSCSSQGQAQAGAPTW
jgi:hypothetical protein